MLNKTVKYENEVYNSTIYGAIHTITEEFYKTNREVQARAKELRDSGKMAYVMEGYWCPTNNYRVLYAYKA